MSKKKWRFRQQKRGMRDIAEQRILGLFKLAEATSDIELAASYVHLARKIASRTRLKVPRLLQRSACPSCHSPLRPGVNATIRLRSRPKRVVIHCNRCGRIIRRPLSSPSEERLGELLRP